MSAASKLATMAELLGTIAESDCRVGCAQAGRSGEFSVRFIWLPDGLCITRLWPSQEMMDRIINNDG